MSIILTIIAFIFILGILVFVHELGHFLAARRAGMKVEEFGFGFPPRVFGFRRGETIYSFNLIPFGGFVKICGEDGSPSDLPAEALTRSFGVQKAYIRALVLSAGVLFNLLLAWPLLTATYLIGAPVSVEENGIPGNYFKEKGVMIIQIQEGMPAELSDLRPGDYLLRFFGKNEKTLEISDIKEVQNFIANHPEEEIRMDYLRKGKVFSTKAIPLKNPENGKGILGIQSHKAFYVYASAWSTLSLIICIFIGLTRTPGQSLIVWLMLFLSLTYNYIRPIYMLNNLYVATANCLPLLLPNTSNSYWLACAIFFMIFGREIMKDILDIKHDLPYKLTLPIKIGNREAEETAIVFYVIACFSTIGIAPNSVTSALLSITISLAIVIIIHLYIKSNRNKLRCLDVLTGVCLSWVWLRFLL